MDMSLQLEFGPHGQHLGLLLHGVRQDIAHSFPMQYEAEISPDRDHSYIT